MKAKNPEPQTIVYFSDKIAFQGIFPPSFLVAVLKKPLTINNYSFQWQNTVSKNFSLSFLVFFFFLVACYIQTSKTRDNHLFQLKKKGFKEFHSSFLSFFGVASIFRLQREHSCDCVLTDTSLWSLRIYTEFYLRTLWFHDHIKHQ